MKKHGKRIKIFVGHFGSGKTEIAINCVLDLKNKGLNAMIVDLDIVNPFFRTADVRRCLEQSGIKVITPNFASTALDVPSIPASVYSAFDSDYYSVVLDVGGDDAGAKVLGNLSDHIKTDTYDMFFVINARRPLSSDVESVVSLLFDIERASKLKVTGLINNTNLSYETTAYDIIEGQALVNQVSRNTGIPIVAICCTSDVIQTLPDEYADMAIPIELFLHTPWQQ